MAIIFSLKFASRRSWQAIELRLILGFREQTDKSGSLKQLGDNRAFELKLSGSGVPQIHSVGNSLPILRLSQDELRAFS